MIVTPANNTSLADALIKETYKKKALPFVVIRDDRLQREILKKTTPEQWKLLAKVDADLMKEMDAFVSVRNPENATELSDISSENMQVFSNEYMKPVHFDVRIPDTKWVVLRWPSVSFAQNAGMSTEAFEDLYFRVCNLDYRKMDAAMDPLVKLMEKTDKIRISGNGTELVFSIKNIPVVKCSGQANIPDGEIFTAPVKDSVNGFIQYNAKTNYDGTVYDGIHLEFKDGKIVEANAGHQSGLVSYIH